MGRRAGSADLPLHGGRVPKWLGERMTRLGAVISEAIVHHYGRDEPGHAIGEPFRHVPAVQRQIGASRSFSHRSNIPCGGRARDGATESLLT